MPHRPLIPILFSFLGGILVGHYGLSEHQSVGLLIFLTTVFLLIFTLLVPFWLRFSCFILLFFLVGILLDLHKHRESELLPLANARERVIIEGTVLEQPSVNGTMTRFPVRTERLFIHGRLKQVSEKVQLTVYTRAGAFLPGEKIRFPARLRAFKNFGNPGRYNYRLAMGLKGFSCAASLSDGRRIVPMGRGDLNFTTALLEAVRRPIRELFQRQLSPRDRALFRALILGERQDITSELREPFNKAGLGHILAVSGLHIGLVGWLAFVLIKGVLSRSYKLALQTDIRKLAAAFTCLPVVAYACLAGFQVSSQRAMIMALAYLFSIVLGREKEIWSTLALAALVVLALDPHALFSISFQLSFFAVVGILWLVPTIYSRVFAPLNEKIKQWKIVERLCVYLGGLIVVTVSATIFLIPITAFYFHRISLVAIPANLLVVPILGLWIIPLGLLAALCLPISQSLAEIFLGLGAWGTGLMSHIIDFFSNLSWAFLWTFTPNVSEVLLYYGLVFCVFFLRRWRWSKMALLLVLLLLGADISYWVVKTRFNQDLKVTYLDVAQGNSALIQFPGNERMLIDGGGFSRGTFDVGKMVVAPFLWHSKLLRIDYLVLTHPQADHMNGLHFVASHFHPKEFWYNGMHAESGSFMDLMNIIESKKIRKMTPTDLGTAREISGVKIEVLHPFIHEEYEKPFKNSVNHNNQSLVLKLSYGGKSLLFPGDLERAGEAMVISRAGPRLRSDILLAPHHGSKTSSTTPFLRMVRPRLCIISSGGARYFGFPHLETLKRFEEVGCEIIRTDQVGAVQLKVGEGLLEVGSFLGGPLKLVK